MLPIARAAVALEWVEVADPLGNAVPNSIDSNLQRVLIVARPSAAFDTNRPAVVQQGGGIDIAGGHHWKPQCRSGRVAGHGDTGLREARHQRILAMDTTTQRGVEAFSR